MPYETFPSTLYIMWHFQLQSLNLLRPGYIYKRKSFMTFDFSNEKLASTLYIMWPIHLKSLKLLPPIVYEKIQLQETWQMDGRWTDLGTKLI